MSSLTALSNRSYTSYNCMPHHLSFFYPLWHRPCEIWMHHNCNKYCTCLSAVVLGKWCFVLERISKISTAVCILDDIHHWWFTAVKSCMHILSFKCFRDLWKLNEGRYLFLTPHWFSVFTLRVPFSGKFMASPFYPSHVILITTLFMCVLKSFFVELCREQLLYFVCCWISE